MFAAFDLDGEGSGYAFEVCGAGAGNDDDGHVGAVCVHGGGVLEGEATVFAGEGSGNDFDGDVAGLALFGVARGEHFALGGGFEVAVNLLVDGEAAESLGGWRCEWFDFDGKDAFGVLGHDGFLWPMGWGLGEDAEREEDEGDERHGLHGSAQTPVCWAHDAVFCGRQVRMKGEERGGVGRLEVITGPMFCGKSEELIRRLKRARIARQRVACFKPDMDLRYHRTAIASHGAQFHEAETVAGVERLRETVRGRLDTVDVVGVDEAQFMDEGIVPLALELVHAGKRVIAAGLDMTFAGEPFGPMPALMAVADEVVKLSAVCVVCGAPAIHSQRVGESLEVVVVGASGVYEARCRRCFRPFVEDGAAQMTLLRMDAAGEESRG